MSLKIGVFSPRTVRAPVVASRRAPEIALAKDSKFVQIAATSGFSGPGSNTTAPRLYALDDQGTVWLLSNSTKKWQRVTMERIDTVEPIEG